MKMTEAQLKAWRTTRLPSFAGGMITCHEGPDEFYCRVLTGAWCGAGPRPEINELGPFDTFEEAQRVLIMYGRILLEKEKAVLDEREKILNKGVGA